MKKGWEESMNSRQLEYFLAVAHELNFTKAAESMYVSQTAVTQQMEGSWRNSLVSVCLNELKRKLC